jgi:hypothetical protein
MQLCQIQEYAAELRICGKAALVWLTPDILEQTTPAAYQSLAPSSTDQSPPVALI